MQQTRGVAGNHANSAHPPAGSSLHHHPPHTHSAYLHTILREHYHSVYWILCHQYMSNMRLPRGNPSLHHLRHRIHHYTFSHMYRLPNHSSPSNHTRLVSH